jgi:hypothetical protein
VPILPTREPVDEASCEHEHQGRDDSSRQETARHSSILRKTRRPTKWWPTLKDNQVIIRTFRPVSAIKAVDVMDVTIGAKHPTARAATAAPFNHVVVSVMRSFRAALFMTTVTATFRRSLPLGLPLRQDAYEAGVRNGAKAEAVTLRAA